MSVDPRFNEFLFDVNLNDNIFFIFLFGLILCAFWLFRGISPDVILCG